MQIKVTQEAFKRGLAVVAPAIAGKSTLPVLLNVLIAADESGLKLTATDLDIGIVMNVSAKVDSFGAVTIPHKALQSFINDLPSDLIEMSLDVDTQTLNLKCGKHKASFKGIEADDFPQMPQTKDGLSLTMPAESWQSVQRRVAIVALDDTTRPVLNAVHLRYSGDSAMFEAADGYRAAQLTMRLDTPKIKTRSVLISLRALEVASKFATGNVVMSADPSSGHISFDDGTVRIIGRGIEGKFPDVDRIIPHECATRTIVDSVAFARATKLANGFAAQSANIITLNIATNKLTISARADESGDNETEIDVMVEGTPYTINLNNTYVAEGIAACGSQQIGMEVPEGKRPMVFRPVGSEDYVHVIMDISKR